MLRFFKARFFGGLPAAQMEAPHIYAPSHAPNGSPAYFCGCTAHLPALPRLCLGSPSRRAGALSSPSRGGIPALPPLQVPREPTPRPRPPGGHLTSPAAWVAASPVGSYMPPVGRRLPPRGCAKGPPTPPPLWGGSPFKIEDKQVSPGCAQR